MADRVVAVAAVDRLRPVGGVGNDKVVAEAAGQHVGAKAPRQIIIAVAGGEDVVAVGAIETVIASAARQQVVAMLAKVDVIAGLPGQLVVAVAAPQEVVVIAAVDDVVVGLAVQLVVAVAAIDQIGAGQAKDRIIAAERIDGVGPNRAGQRIAVIGAGNRLACRCGPVGMVGRLEVGIGEVDGIGVLENDQRLPVRAAGAAVLVPLEQGVGAALLQPQEARAERVGAAVPAGEQAQKRPVIAREPEHVAAGAGREVGDDDRRRPRLAWASSIVSLPLPVVIVLALYR